MSTSLHSQSSSFLCVVPSFHLVWFSFHFKNFLNISCSVSLLVTNPLSFCLPKNVFVLSSFLKDIISPGYRILGCELSFSLRTLKMSFHCLWLAGFLTRSQPVLLSLFACLQCISFSMFSPFSLVFSNFILTCSAVILCLSCREFIKILRSVLL